MIRLGDRIEEWLRNLFITINYFKYWGILQERSQTVRNELGITPDKPYGILNIGNFFQVTLGSLVYMLFGVEAYRPSALLKTAAPIANEIDAFTSNPQKYIQEKLHEFATSPDTVAFSQIVGTIVTEPVVSLLETFAERDQKDPHEMARAFHGIASGLPWGAKTLDTALQAALGDRAPHVGKYIDSLYWGLGLGFLGWQTLAPLLSSGLQPRLERYYKKLYTPERFSANEMRDLRALNLVSPQQMQDTLRESGWRDEDIALWEQLKYRTLSEGTIWDLYNNGSVSQGWVVERLRALGYDPNDISYLFLTHEKEPVNESLRYTLSTAKAALKNGIIGADEFRQILTTLKYEPREIDLQILIVQAQAHQEAKELTTGQIKALYDNKIIGRDEAIHNLLQLEYTQDVAAQLVKLWDTQAIPKAARINKSTITAAYREGVIGRGEAKTMLQNDAGFTDQDSEFLLRIEDAIAKRKSEALLTGPAALTLAQLKEFVDLGLITRDQLEARPEFNRYSAADKAIIISSFYVSPIPQPREISESALISAYVAGIITRQDLTDRLTSRNITPEDVELVIRTVELENPQVFGEFTGPYIGQPTIGQVQLALQRGLIDETQFRDRLSQMGMGLDAIEIMLFNAQYQAPAEPKKFTDATIFRLYGDGWLTRPEALERLLQNNYTVDDANLLLDAELKGLYGTELAQLFEAGFMDKYTFEFIATNQGWTIDDINLYYREIGLL